MSGEHTPGPWMVNPDNPAEILYDDRDDEDVTPLIATVEIDNTTSEQCQADARLIAAAPSLLAALYGMLAHSCVADAGADMKDDEDHAAERAARAAIAKAEGAS